MYAPSPPAGIDALADLLRGRRVTVLTGAGISAERTVNTSGRSDVTRTPLAWYRDVPSAKCAYAITRA